MPKQLQFYVHFDSNELGFFNCKSWDRDYTVEDLRSLISEKFGIPAEELEVYCDKLLVEKERLTGQELIDDIVDQNKIISFFRLEIADPIIPEREGPSPS